MDAEAHARRLRWRCRRGMRELDVLLMGYVDSVYAQAPAAERSAFEALISMPDPEILALLTGRLEAQDPALRDVVERLLHLH